MAKKSNSSAETATTQAEDTAQVEAVPQETAEEINPNEPKYTANEFIEAAQCIFNVMPECVAAALKKADKTEFTLTEAKKIVSEFMKREVK